METVRGLMGAKPDGPVA